MCVCVHPRNQFDNFTTHNSHNYFFVFSLLSLSLYSIYIFIRSSIAVAVAAVIAAAACLCMPENNANACTLLTTATIGASERESKPISNNKKCQVHDREKE
jgi:hypothetical protein